SAGLKSCATGIRAVTATLVEQSFSSALQPPSSGRRDVLPHELAAQNLADQALRQLRAELDRLRHLERRELLAAELSQLLVGCLVARAKHHPRLDRFAAERIGYPSHPDLGNRRVLREHFLDLSRPHLVTAGLDQVLLAIGEEDV